MTQDYYDGASDALTEAVGEIKAIFTLGDNTIQPEDFRNSNEYWQALAIHAVETLRSSYDGDAQFMKAYRERNSK